VLSLRQDEVIFQLRKETFLLLSLIILELASVRVTLHAPILYYGKEREKKKCINVRRRHVLHAWDCVDGEIVTVKKNKHQGRIESRSRKKT